MPAFCAFENKGVSLKRSLKIPNALSSKRSLKILRLLLRKQQATNPYKSQKPKIRNGCFLFILSYLVKLPFKCAIAAPSVENINLKKKPIEKINRKKKKQIFILYSNQPPNFQKVPLWARKCPCRWFLEICQKANFSDFFLKTPARREIR